MACFHFIVQLDLYPVRKMYTVFDDDGLTSSHPVYLPLADTTEIRQVFDTISYNKVRK